MRKNKDMKTIIEARTAKIIRIHKYHESLTNLYNEVEGSSMADQTHALKRHTTKTNVIQLNITVRDYVVTNTHKHRNHKLKFKCHGPMSLKQAKSSLVFIVVDLMNANQQTLHAQRTVSYPIRKAATRISDELKQQAIHYDTTAHLVHNIYEKRVTNNDF